MYSNVLLQNIVIAGLPVNVFRNPETHNGVAPPVSVLFILHGWLRDMHAVTFIAEGVLQLVAEASKLERAGKELIIVTFVSAQNRAYNCDIGNG